MGEENGDSDGLGMFARNKPINMISETLPKRAANHVESRQAGACPTGLGILPTERRARLHALDGHWHPPRKSELQSVNPPSRLRSVSSVASGKSKAAKSVEFTAGHAFQCVGLF